MKRIITPAFIALVIAAGFAVDQPYAAIGWSLAGIAAAIWTASEVIRWRRAR